MEQKPIKEGLYVTKGSGVALTGCRCTNCGKVFFPAQTLCTACYEANMEPAQLTGPAKLLTYTVTRVPVGPLPLPHAVGILDFPEGVRVTAPLMVADSYHIGAEYVPVEDVLYADEEVAYLCYKFKEADR